MSRWLIRKHPDDGSGYRWRVSFPNAHPDAYTPKASWVDAMVCVAKLDREVYGKACS